MPLFRIFLLPGFEFFKPELFAMHLVRPMSPDGGTSSAQLVGFFFWCRPIDWAAAAVTPRVCDRSVAQQTAGRPAAGCVAQTCCQHYRQAPFSIEPDAADANVPVNLSDVEAAARGVQLSQKTAGTVPSAPATVPPGGLFWDRREDTFQMQALGPMLNPVEMANAREAEIAAKLARASYAGQLRQLYGAYILEKPALLVQEAMSVVGRYEFEDESFHPFTSKYDYWLEGRVRMSPAELRGMRLFNDPDKANCAGCHLSQPGTNGLPPLFTDTQYEALGVPRNELLSANRNPAFFDMGICGPFRKYLAAQTQYCGMFFTPTLRNVAGRPAFFTMASITDSTT